MRFREIISLAETTPAFPDIIRNSASKIFAYCGGYDPELFEDDAILGMRAEVAKLIASKPVIYRLFIAPPSFVNDLQPGASLSSSRRYNVASWTTDFSEMDLQTLHVEDTWPGYDDDQGDQNPLFAAAGSCAPDAVDIVSTICQRLNMPWENEMAMKRGMRFVSRGIFTVSEDGPLSLGKQIRPDLIGKQLSF